MDKPQVHLMKQSIAYQTMDFTAKIYAEESKLAHLYLEERLNQKKVKNIPLVEAFFLCGAGSSCPIGRSFPKGKMQKV